MIVDYQKTSETDPIFSAAYTVTEFLGGTCNRKMSEYKLRIALLKLYNLTPSNDVKNSIDNLLKGNEITPEGKKTILKYTKPLVERAIGTSPVKSEYSNQ